MTPTERMTALERQGVDYKVSFAFPNHPVSKPRKVLSHCEDWLETLGEDNQPIFLNVRNLAHIKIHEVSK